ncbi:uncharacterized protein LOC125461194 isoform X2 [Stegostoma tigrinum]|uniref:uncharacterized protein LOC125461194 isoform X2 n=1 Tax=Stegostoma tigrinum TaxID=3053191 RepID=UPI00202B4DDE|nr:uncharacterized protein LOC125461194 isoform X2 [Stegostoma tigrinum]
MIRIKDLTVEKQAWLLNAVKSRKLTLGQGIDEMNKTLVRMDGSTGNSSSMHQLSNDEQLRLLNAVKNRELTIDQAWQVAKGGKPTFHEPGKPDKIPENTQYNFSVYKYNRYRRQKRVLMIIQLLNQIIQNNIYETHQMQESGIYTPRQETGVIKEGQLELQKGGLASVKWNRYSVQLRKGQLSFQRLNLTEVSEQLSLTPNVIYFSDGNASVHEEVGSGSFTVITKKNCYLFRIPFTDQLKSAEDVTRYRDEWIDAIDKCCLHWKRLSQAQLIAENDLVGVKQDIPFSKEPADQTALNQLYLPANSTQEEEKEQKEDDRKEAEDEEGTELASPVTKMAPGSPLETVVLPPVTQSLPASTPLLLPLSAPAIPVAPPLPMKKSTSVAKKTKAFHWDVIAPEKIQKSIWGQSNVAKIQLHHPRLLEQFCTQEIPMHSVNDFSTHPQILLNQKVAHNFNIFLKSFPVKVTELRAKFLIIEEENGGLTNEQIASLRRYVPTPDDIEKYKMYKGSQADLHIVDQYMMEMCNISCLSHRLDLILSIREFPETIDDLLPLVTQKIKACSQLLESKLFVLVLEYLLAIGNFLNTHAGKKKVKGFCLSSLTKVGQLRGKDRKFTLLHALVEQIISQDPALANFHQELTEFEDVPGDSIKGLIAEVDVLKNELVKIHLHTKVFKSKNKMSSDGQFYKGLKDIIQKYEAKLSDLTKQCDEMKKLYNSILVKFGEPQNRDSQEMFGWISSFIKDFRRAVTEQRNYKWEAAQK